MDFIERAPEDYEVLLETTCVWADAEFVDYEVDHSVDVDKHGAWGDKIREDWECYSEAGEPVGNRLDDYDTSLAMSRNYLIFRESAIEYFYHLYKIPKADKRRMKCRT